MKLSSLSALLAFSLSLSLGFVSSGAIAKEKNKIKLRPQSSAETPAHPIPIQEGRQETNVMSAYEGDSGPHEDWKGVTEHNRFEVGVLGGLGQVRAIRGFALIPTIAIKTCPDGFIPDIADSASIEIEAGPILMSGGRHPFFSSTHLRWDFRRNSNWIFYAIGGVSTTVDGHAPGTSQVTLNLRTGVGAMMDVGKVFNLRAELSNELIALGIALPLF